MGRGVLTITPLPPKPRYLIIDSRVGSSFRIAESTPSYKYLIEALGLFEVDHAVEALNFLSAQGRPGDFWTDGKLTVMRLGRRF